MISLQSTLRLLDNPIQIWVQELRSGRFNSHKSFSHKNYSQVYILHSLKIRFKLFFQSLWKEYFFDTLLKSSYVIMYLVFNQLVAPTIVLMRNVTYVIWRCVCVCMNPYFDMKTLLLGVGDFWPGEWVRWWGYSLHVGLSWSGWHSQLCGGCHTLGELQVRQKLLFDSIT